MPLTQTSQIGNYKPAQEVQVDWESFRRGLNDLLRDSELNPEETRKMDNLRVVGKGIVTVRPGTNSYYTAYSTGKLRALKGVKSKTGTNELLALTDSGILTKKSGSSYTVITGASFSSGYFTNISQVQNNIYISNYVDALTKYDFTSLTRYTQINRPTQVAASKISGPSGTFTWSWRVGVENAVGETLSTPVSPEAVVSLTSQPENYSATNYAVISWTAPSAPSGAITGYNIYGREAGNETFLTRVPATVTSWFDTGVDVPSFTVFPQEADSTGGPKAKYQIDFKGDKLILANISSNPSRLMFSGSGPFVDKFHWGQGGGYIDVAKDDGTEITGLITFEDRIIIFKERSIYELSLTLNATLGIVQPTVKLINGAVGALFGHTILQVENDLLFVGQRPGTGISVNSLGYEPNILNVLRTAEISARVRSTMSGMNALSTEGMAAVYWNNYYMMLYPEGNSANNTKILVYDRERLAWYGPWTVAGSVATVYYDSTNASKLLLGSNTDGTVSEMNDSYATDLGSAITTDFMTKKEDFGKPVTFKTVKDMFIWFRNVTGNVNVSILTEDRSGTTNTAKTLTISGSNSLVGWGYGDWGTFLWGASNAASSTQSASDIVKYLLLNKQSRTIQIEVTTTGTGAKYELLGIQANAAVNARLNIPGNWRKTTA